MDENCLSRAELLSGGFNRSRRATKLLSAIEARCAHMRDESRRVVAAYLLDSDQDFSRRFDVNYLQSLKLAASSHQELLLDHLERFVPQWKPLVPPDPELRARIIRLMRDKYGIGPRTFAALGGGDQEVQAAYQRVFNDPLENASDVSSPVPAKEKTRPAGDADQVWEDVETRLEWLNLASGETLYRAGDPGDALYVVISGRMQAATAGEDGCEHLVGEMGRGELLGEMEVLTGDVRSATVRAVRDSELVRLGRSELLTLAQRHLQVMFQINALIARRLRRQYVNPGPAESTLLSFALIPCDASVPLQDVGRQLAQALGELGPTTYITCADLDAAIEPGAAQAALDDPRNAQIVSWLSELESRYRTSPQGPAQHARRRLTDYGHQRHLSAAVHQESGRPDSAAARARNGHAGF